MAIVTNREFPTQFRSLVKPWSIVQSRIDSVHRFRLIGDHRSETARYAERLRLQMKLNWRVIGIRSRFAAYYDDD